MNSIAFAESNSIKEAHKLIRKGNVYEAELYLLKQVQAKDIAAIRIYAYYLIKGKFFQKNVHKGIGLNARLDTLQAAILLSKLKIFEKEINLREKIVLEIKKKLIKKSNKFKFQKVEKNLKSANAQFPIKLKTRNKFIVYLKKNKIGYSIFYPKPIYKQKGYNEKKIFLKNVEKVCKEIICFPVNPYMSKSEIIRFTNKLKNF